MLPAPRAFQSSSTRLARQGGSWSSYTNPGTSTTTYRHDAEGQLIAVTLNGTETRLVQDVSQGLSRLLMETNSSNQSTAIYVYGIVLSYRIDVATGTVRYYHADPNGNVVALTNEVGVVTDRYAFTPFGQQVGSQGNTKNPFRFGGAIGVYSPGDGTLIMRARIYVPELARFTTPDLIEQPLSSPQTRNVYSYAYNNPWGFVDPTGLTGERDDGGSGGGGNLDLQAFSDAADIAEILLSGLEYAGQKGIEALQDFRSHVLDAARNRGRGVSLDNFVRIGNGVIQDLKKLKGATKAISAFKKAFGIAGYALDIAPELPEAARRFEDRVDDSTSVLEQRQIAQQELGFAVIRGVGKGTVDFVTLPYRVGPLKYIVPTYYLDPEGFEQDAAFVRVVGDKVKGFFDGLGR